MKADVNHTLLTDGPDAVRARSDQAKRFSRNAKQTNGEADANRQTNGEAAPRANLLDGLRLELSDDTTIPEREWGVRGRFPRRNVALLSGHGGAGKSVLLLQLMVAHILGADWLRSMPEG